jgi:hypothetical protein
VRVYQPNGRKILTHCFQYQFIDGVLDEMCASDPTEKASEMAIYLSIFIVLMGVLSTVSLHLVHVTAKELGIRQILGASFSEINWLFLREQLVNFIM